MYNRYQGNSGRVEKVKEKPKAQAVPKQQPKENKKLPPPKTLPSPLSTLLPKGALDLETEDIILLLMLYLMYRKSGDSDLLIMMGAMFLL